MKKWIKGTNCYTHYYDKDNCEKKEVANYINEEDDDGDDEQ